MRKEVDGEFINILKFSDDQMVIAQEYDDAEYMFQKLTEEYNI